MSDERIDYFISYNNKDRQWAEWLAWIIEDAGFSTVLQAWDFSPGSNFVLEMDKATKRAESTIVVLSDNYLNAEFTHPEWAAAFAKDPQGRDGKLLPVRVGECSPDGLLGQIVWIDIVGLTEAEARAGTRVSTRKDSQVVVAVEAGEEASLPGTRS